MNNLKVGCDPVNEVSDFSVDSRVSSCGTAISPGNNTGQVTSRNGAEWATRISLARVLSSLWETSAEHGLKEVFVGVGRLAFRVRDNWDLDLLEDVRALSTAAEGSPSRDHDVSGGLLSLAWEGNGGNVRVEVEVLGEEEESNVVLVSEVSVVLVDDDPVDVTDLLQARVLGLGEVSSGDGEGSWGRSFNTMGSCDDKLLSVDDDQGASAVVTAVVTEIDLVWELTLGGWLSSNDQSSEESAALDWAGQSAGSSHHSEKDECELGHFWIELRTMF